MLSQIWEKCCSWCKPETEEEEGWSRCVEDDGTISRDTSSFLRMRRFFMVKRSGSVPFLEERMREVAREREVREAESSFGMGEVVRCCDVTLG